MDIQVFGDKVIFRELPEQENDNLEKIGSIFVPKTVTDAARQQRRNYTGEVVFAGEGCKFVKVGDKISYDQFSVVTFIHDKESLLIARENDLIGRYL